MSADRSILRAAGALAAMCGSLAVAVPVHAGQPLGAGDDESSRTVAPSAGPAMPFGATAVPPMGFLALCERSPEDCLTPDGPRPDIAAIRAAANRRFWEEAFARRSRGPAALRTDAPAPRSARPDSTRPLPFDWSQVFLAAGSPLEGSAAGVSASAGPAPVADSGTVVAGGADTAKPVFRLASAAPWTAMVHPATLVIPREAVATSMDVAAINRIDLDAGIAMAAADAARPALDIQASAMVEGQAEAALDAPLTATVEEPASGGMEASGTSPASVFTLDAGGWSLVNQINRRANRSIRQIADQRQYGVEDYWATPPAAWGRGDCEDYVLAKRRDLIAAGVPAEALSIAIVETRWGESHAVLLLASDQGEYVLDNLTPWISRWDRVNYTWHERQVPGRPFDWVRAAV